MQAQLDLIQQQKTHLREELVAQLQPLAQSCLPQLHNPQALNNILTKFLPIMPSVNLAYITDTKGLQISANVYQTSIDSSFIGQDLSARPFCKCNSGEFLTLSDTYISYVDLSPCISAICIIGALNRPKAYLIMDLNPSSLNLPKLQITHKDWQQIKGDPSIRENIFKQKRIISAMDRAIDTVHNITYELLTSLGVFHIKLHYPSSRATVWTYNDPYNYNIHVLDEITNPDICLIYPKLPYPKEAIVSANKVREVLDGFTYLRNMDDNLYLRTGSINIINGMIGITFSCDGNHYLQVDEFLKNIANFG